MFLRVIVLLRLLGGLKPLNERLAALESHDLPLLLSLLGVLVYFPLQEGILSDDVTLIEDVEDAVEQFVFVGMLEAGDELLEAE